MEKVSLLEPPAVCSATMDEDAIRIAATNPLANSPVEKEIQLHELNSTGNHATTDAPSQQPDSTSATDQQEPDKVYYFGCRLWHPQWLQVFANAKFYTVILCLFVIVEASITAGELKLHFCNFIEDA